MTPRSSLFGALVLSACTYGPTEDAARVEHIVALENSYDAWVVVRHDRYRRPTGLSTFPDGGRWRFEAHEAALYLIDAELRSEIELVRREAPDGVWESFSAAIRAIDGDSVAYLALNGCPRGGECHPDLWRHVLLRVSTSGDVRRVDSIPASVELPGIMVARRPGEERYVRYGRAGDLVTARFMEDGPYEPLFRLRPNGILEPVAASR